MSRMSWMPSVPLPPACGPKSSRPMRSFHRDFQVFPRAYVHALISMACKGGRSKHVIYAFLQCLDSPSPRAGSVIQVNYRVHR